MNQNLQKLFPSFSNALVEEINDKSFENEEIIMKTGHYIKNTVLVLSGKIKIYREDAGRDFFIYYLQPSQTCVI